MTRLRLGLFAGAIALLFAIALAGPSAPQRPPRAPRTAPLELEAPQPVAVRVPRSVEPARAEPRPENARAPAVLVRNDAQGRGGAAGSGNDEPDESEPPPEASDATATEPAPPFQAETERWDLEQADPVDGPRREAHAARFFQHTEGAPLQHIECRSTLCRVTLRASGLQAALPVASELGVAASIADYQPDHVVILVPAESIDELPGA